MLRLFVGIALPPELKLRLSLLASGLSGARWVDAGNYHVTLRFIGEVDEGMAADIDDALISVKVRNFPIALVGLGSFGEGRRRHALWVGVQHSEQLQRLYGKIDHALTRIGLKPEGRRYMPHVTLARLKDTAPADLERFVTGNADFRAEPFMADRFMLVASYLTRSGAIYEDAAEYALTG